MTAKDYPVTFGYGAVDGYWYGPNGKVGKYHKGEDRPTPIGTPVVVNGVTIGLTGATGAVSGPHIHIGRFNASGADMNPNGGGFSLGDPVVEAVGYNNVDGNYVRLRTSLGEKWAYLHLSRVDVSQGQSLNGQGDTMVTDRAQLDRLYLAVLHRNRGAGEGEDVYLGKDSGWVFDDLYRSSERARTMQVETDKINNLNVTISSLKETLSKTSNGSYVPLTDVIGKLYIKQ